MPSIYEYAYARRLRDKHGAGNDESPFRPVASETLVWQSGITRFQSQGIETLGTLMKVASGKGSLVTS
jgi:hypothetical protein